VLFALGVAFLVAQHHGAVTPNSGEPKPNPTPVPNELPRPPAYAQYEFTPQPLACSPVAWRFRSTVDIVAARDTCAIGDADWTDVIAIGSASSGRRLRVENARALRRGEHLAAILAKPGVHMHILNLGMLRTAGPPASARQLLAITATRGADHTSTTDFDEQLRQFLLSHPVFTTGSLCDLYDGPAGGRLGKSASLGCSREPQP
jgi:hypothetical protein